MRIRSAELDIPQLGETHNVNYSFIELGSNFSNLLS